MLKTNHLSRYKDIAALLAKHARVGLSISRGAEPVDEDTMQADAERLAQELESMGPTFVKLAQLLSTRSDLLPEPYLAALARLQDMTEPFPFEDVKRIVTTELGVRLSNAFASFDEKPLASASLAQVHRAALRDGRAVAVKVQRPNIRAQIVDDLDAIESVAAFADAHTQTGRQLGFAGMVDEFRRSMLAELDYLQEARNLKELGSNLARHERIVVPQPLDDYSTSVVLTMELVAGRNIARLGPLALMEVDGNELARQLFSAYLDQILVDGLFHADPHPGNVLVTDDGRLALIDLGMVARVGPEMQDSLIKLLLAVSDGRGHDAADVAVAVGQKLDWYDDQQFRYKASELIARHQSASMRDVHAGALIAELTRIAGTSGLRLPRELTMLGKALLNLDEIVRVLDPTFDPNAAIRHNSADLMRRKLIQASSPGSVMAAAMEVKEFAERLPGQVNKVMDALAAGELTLNVKGIDERDLMRGVQKLANRLTAGLVVASLVVGAALIMRIPTHSRLFGYPALAIILFLIASAAALVLLVQIQVSDLPQRRHRARARRKRTPPPA